MVRILAFLLTIQETFRPKIEAHICSFLNFGQWKKLSAWLAQRTGLLFDQLTDRYILFGEWCYAEHSIRYDRLPDWFLGFDIYERCRAKFLSSTRRDTLFQTLDIS